MHAKTPMIGVVGRNNSGKTTVIESIVPELTKSGYRVATAKHVNQKGFSVDTKGKDTWKHSKAGANPIVIVSDIETAVLIKDGARQFSLDRLRSFTPDANIIVLEGFSWLVLNDGDMGKILCIRNREEYEDLRGKARGEVIAFCSVQPMGEPILRIKEDTKILVERTLRYVRRKLQKPLI